MGQRVVITVVLNHIFQLKILHFTDLVNFIHYGSRKIKGNRTSGRYHHGLRVKVIGDGCSGFMWNWGCYYGGSFRMKKTLVHLDSNRETIIVMMRYGGAIDQIAEELGYSEQELVEYIKSSGLDKQLSRRSW